MFIASLLPLRLANPFPLSAPIFQSQRYALLHNTARLRSRASPVRKFYQSDFLSATHSGAARYARTDQKPPGSLRRSFDNIPPNYIVLGILGLNGVVFAAWSYATPYMQVGVPPSARWLKRWLLDNFINSYENIRRGRFWTLVTSSFSHAQPGHALVNGFTFWFLAPTALAVLGNAHFLMLYLGSGVFANLASLVWNKQGNYYSHGASGAIYALASFFAFAAPNARFLLFFVLPMPAWACIGGIACFDVYNAFTRRFPSLDSAGHVGGLAAGALYWMMRARFRLF
ncbi:hypothetical protein BC827DRAFT_1129057 [Russula dissimulans]|nr:hypothetical protein BC827DRAFT_1129057 [Russula dissimulans]